MADAMVALEARLASLEQNGFKLNPATANPATLGLYGFALTTSLLMGIKTEVVDTSNSNSTGQVMGFAMFFGGLAQFTAGIFEYQRRNSFGFVAFCCYGAFWMSVSLYSTLMQFGNGIETVQYISAAGGSGGANITSPLDVATSYVYAGPSTAYPRPGYKMAAMWHSMWGILTFLLWLCTFNLNVITSLLFLTLAILFFCLAGGEVHPSVNKGAGGFGFFVAFLAFYDGTAAMMKETYGREIIPVFPLKPINRVAGGQLGGFGTKKIVTDVEKA